MSIFEEETNMNSFRKENLLKDGTEQILHLSKDNMPPNVKSQAVFFFYFLFFFSVSNGL